MKFISLRSALFVLLLAITTMLTPSAEAAGQKDPAPRAVTLVLDFPLLFVNNLATASGDQHAGHTPKPAPAEDHKGHSDHSGHSEQAGHAGHEQSAGSSVAAPDSFIVAHKTFQDRLLVFKGENVSTLDGLTYRFDASRIKGFSGNILTYFRRGKDVAKEPLGISYSSVWKMVGIVSGGKERVLQEGTIKGGVRDFLSGERPSEEIGKIKNKVDPKALPVFDLDALESALGLKPAYNGEYRLEMRVSTAMTAFVGNKGRTDGKEADTAFSLKVLRKGGKRTHMELEFPYTLVTAELPLR